MVESFVYPIPSLLNLSLHQITNNKTITSRKEQLAFLPPNLKDPIRKVLLKRGATDQIETIKSLLHSNIRSLDLSECQKTKQLFNMIVEFCGHLRRLNLNSNISEDNHGLSEDLSLLLKKNRYLSSLSMRNFSSADDSALLNLSKCLTELDLGGCTGITDKGISGMLEKCVGITSLSLNRTLITDSSLTALGLSPCQKTLKELNVSSCVHITDQGIEDFLVGIKMRDNQPVLNILIFHKCPGLSETSRLLVDDFFRETNITAKQISWTIY